jgi:hypothetical protein
MVKAVLIFATLAAWFYIWIFASILNQETFVINSNFMYYELIDTE